MMFAYWTETPTNKSTTDPLGLLQTRRSTGIEMDARLFIVDVPEGTSRDEVQSRSGRYVEASCGHEGETLKCGFSDECPLDIRNEFRDVYSEVIKLPWAEL
jgi:hypothetical protein